MPFSSSCECPLCDRTLNVKIVNLSVERPQLELLSAAVDCTVNGPVNVEPELPASALIFDWRRCRRAHLNVEVGVDVTAIAL
jgi:hypothetical protein